MYNVNHVYLFVRVYRFDPQVEGGDSVFLDSFHVAEELRKQFPEDFESLVRIPATFQKIHFERYGIEALKWRHYNIKFGELIGTKWDDWKE